VKSDGVITKLVASESLDHLGIDKNGLDLMDYKILEALVKNFNGGPVGLDSIGVAISENPRTVEEVYEPYLIKEGYLQRTLRGRIALDKAYDYLKIDKKDQ
jgi:Holliday junction DNA helicase RuvB